MEVHVFEPGGGPVDTRTNRSRDVTRMTPGRAALVSLMRRYLDGLMDPFITLLEVHKLMYFLQEAGEPLKLRYVKGPYGPYAENLRHVLRETEGHLTTGYADGGDQPDKQLSLVPGAVSDAEAFLRTHGDTNARFDRAARLVEGFETPFGLELLTTVHWVNMKEQARSNEEVVSATYAWSERKHRFSAAQIAMALDRLGRNGWLTCRR